MRNSHTDILYHYTKSLDHVFSILKEGFKVSYSAEQITDNIFIAIPMISFCDIPIELCEEHRSKYGYYVVGISKSALISAVSSLCSLLSPVHYVMSDDPIIGAYEHHQQYIKNQALDEQFFRDKAKSGAELIHVIGSDGTHYYGYAGHLKDDCNIMKRNRLKTQNRIYPTILLEMRA